MLKIKEIRDQIKGEIIERYFPEANISLLRKDYSYLDILEEQILNDSAITYSNRVKQILETKEAEEDVFMRGGAFKRQIPKLYNYSCAITGMKVESVGNISLIDACHIVPFAESHNDTVSNGIALCPNMHRAFDRGLISIDENYRVLVSDIFIENYTSYSIHQFEGKEIHLPEISRYYPAQENLEKHRQRFNFG
ncbi:MAG: hypothetical protein C0594_08065 [Marinilabiliales bacterium]|nr:MAG: hypothetical protein C0594_08065 [Marinilabiliales bacterium]